MIKWLLLLTVLAMLTVGQMLHQSDVKDDNFRNITNFTNQLVWNYTYQDSTIEGMGRLTNIVQRFVDFAGYTGFEVTKMGVEYGYENPQYDFHFFMKLVIWIIALSLLAVLLPQIVPIIAIIYLIFYYLKIGLKKLINKRRSVNE